MTGVASGTMSRPPRAVLVSAATALALVLLVAVGWRDTGVPVFVMRLTELLLAGGAAYLLDDAAAVLTDVTPRGIWRRRAPVLGAGAGLLAGAWCLILLVLRWQDSSPPVLAATLEVAVLSAVALAAAAVLARRGEPEPGGLIAPILALLGFGLLIAQPLARTALFPSDADDSATRVIAWWAAAGAVAVLVLLLASRDPASRRRRTRRTQSVGVEV